MNEGTRFDGQYETMPWHKVDTVVFDIGNILIRFAPDDFLQHMSVNEKILSEPFLKMKLIFFQYRNGILRIS